MSPQPTAYTPDPDVVIAAASQCWALGDATIELIAARENKVYRVQSADGTAALRLHRVGYRSIEEIHSELLWLAKLADEGISVARPLKARDGRYVQVIDGVLVDLLTWMDGVPLSQTESSAEIYFNLGCTLANMHRIADDWQLPASFVRPSWDLVGATPSWDQFWNNPGLLNLQQKLLIEFRDTARRALNGLQHPDIGLIHADLVPDNILINGDHLQLIDFDDGGFGYRLFDLATITYRARRANNSDQLRRAVLDGYKSSNRSLNTDDLLLFEAMRACSYLGWNITRLEETNGAARNKRFIAEAMDAVGRYYEEMPA